MLLRTLPNHFPYNSTYTWFPLMTPKAMKGVLGNLELADRYDFTRPGARPQVVSVVTYDAVQKVMENAEGAFASPYGAAARRLVDGQGFFLSFDDPARHQRDRRLVRASLAGLSRRLTAV